MAHVSPRAGGCISSCTGPTDRANRSHGPWRRWLNRSVERGATEQEPSEYVDLLRKLEAAQESDVVDQALNAARQRLGMDAAYVTTIDSCHQTIHGIVGEPAVAERYQDSVIPVEQTYCVRMLA